MGKTFTVAGRELSAHFVSPTAYVLLAVFIVIASYFFMSYNVLSGSSNLANLLANVSLLFVFIAPVLTMRVLADERKSGTDELVLTSPVSLWQWVLGKFLGTYALYLVFLILTLVYPLAIWHYGGVFDWHALLTTYLGMALMGAAFLSLGVWASSLTDNPMVAGMIGFGFALILWIADWASTAAGGKIGSFLSYIAIYTQFGDFANGLIGTEHLVYFLSIIIGGLFLAVRALDARRWA